MHFDKVLNNHRPVDRSVLNLLKQKPCMMVIDNPISFTEVKRAINKLKKGKAPGLNGIPPEALKAMDNVPRRTVHCHVCDFFEGEVDHEGWHQSQCIPVPKRGDLSDPNKWRGIMLMDMCSKVFSSVMTASLASYVGFVDLVKVYDTANHALLIDILRKYGAPPKFTTAVETIYRNNTCVLKIENKIREIPQTVGVRQWDNKAPVLFLFLMTAFAENGTSQYFV